MSKGLLQSAIDALKAKNKATGEAGGRAKAKPSKPKGKSKTQKEIDDEIRRKRAERAARKKAGNLKL